MYQAPLRDMNFVVKEMLGLDYLKDLRGTEAFSPDIFEAILTEAARFSETVLHPLNHPGDLEGCHFEKGCVTTPKGFKEAYQQFVEAGWPSLGGDEAYGGQGMPEILTMLVEEMVSSANLSFGLFPGLTRGAYNLLSSAGSQALKDRYLPNLISGHWMGTMCLTEAQCGTDLGLIRTKAVPQEDGSYHVTGSKIYISSGEHDFSENIIHFVLAKTPDGPQGIKGISLFLIPKIMVKEDGSLGQPNGVTCGSIEHKMGIKASPTCVMNFENAKGYLVGQLHHGVAHMFVMMNLERLGVGNQGLGVGEVAYQNALAFARDRLQGRALTGAKYPEKPADPLMVHPDIRRMLLTMKTYNEGNRMLSAWVAQRMDISHRSQDAQARQEADDFVQLMTPIVKAFLTDCGTEAANLGIQVLGGAGYIKDYGMEQYARDARITQIYEGTNGIQSLDLLGRKVPANMGRSLRFFFHPILAFMDEQAKAGTLPQEMQVGLAKVIGRLQQATQHAAMQGLKNPDEVGAMSVEYLRLFALSAHAFLWARAVLVAQQALDQHPSGKEKVFYESKIQTAQFFFHKILPQSSGLFASIMAGGKTIMAMEDQAFGPF